MESDANMLGSALRPRVAHLASIAHDGKVVVVGTGDDGILYYTVRQSGFEDTVTQPVVTESTLPGFENWRRVPLDKAIPDASVSDFEAASLVDTSGNPIMKSIYGVSAAASASARVKLLSGLGHLYLFRVSAQYALLANRFVLDGLTNELVPKLEVRYRRSGEKLRPDGGGQARPGKKSHDSLGARTVNDEPFCEPATELSFLGVFSPDKPWFSVELLNTGEHGKFRWNFFVYTDERLLLCTVAASREGLFDVQDQRRKVNDPSGTGKSITRTIPGIITRHLRFEGDVIDAFDTSLYHNQIERETKAGPQLLKQSTRVMLSMPVQRPGRPDTEIAAVSFAVNTLGMLARIERNSPPDDLLRAKVKQVLLPLATLDEITLIADRTPPPQGAILKLAESQKERVQITTDADLDAGTRLRAGQNVEISGTRSYDGVYTARAVERGNGTQTFEIESEFVDDDGQGFWEAIEDSDDGLVFENMIASYERTTTGLRISCLSHNVEDGDEIRIAGSVNHDGVHAVRSVGSGADNMIFELEQVWPIGETVNLTHQKRRGLTFDGIGDYLGVGPIALDGHSPRARLERTASAWIWLPDLSPDAEGTTPVARLQTLFCTRNGALHLYLDKLGRATFEVRFADGHRARVTASEPVPTGRWVHVAAVLDYDGEGTGKTDVTVLVGGRVAKTATVAPAKPVHLAARSLRLNRNPLPIKTLNHQILLPESITLEAWINTRQSGDAALVSWEQNGRHALGLSGSDGERVVTWVNNGDTLQGKTHLTQDRWHHIAATYDDETRQRAIYINGELDTESVSQGASPRAERVAELRRDLAIRRQRDADAGKAVKASLKALASSQKRTERLLPKLTEAQTASGAANQRWETLDRQVAILSQPIRLAEQALAVISEQLPVPTDSAPGQAIGRSETSAFEDVVASGEHIIGVNVRAAAWMDGIQLVSESRPLTSHGGLGGRAVDIRFGAGERLVAVSGEFDGNRLTDLAFITSAGLAYKHNGQVVDTNTRSAPGEAPGSFELRAPTGYEISGIHGHAASFLDAIGILVRPDPALVAELERATAEFARTREEVSGSVAFQAAAEALEPADRDRQAAAAVLNEASQAYATEREQQERLSIDHDLARGVAAQTGRAVEAARASLKGPVLSPATLEALAAANADRSPLALGSIGGSGSIDTTAYRGYIGDVRVWRTVRTINDIAADMTHSPDGAEPALAGHWRLDETTARQIHDASMSKAHVSLNTRTNAVDWRLMPHRVPGTAAQIGPQPYQEFFTVGARLEQTAQHAMEFDGLAAHLSLPSMNDDLSAGLTLAGWFRWDSSQGADVIALGNGSGNDDVVLFTRRGGNTLVLRTPAGQVEAVGTLVNTEWTHVAAAIDAGGLARLFINGESSEQWSGQLMPLANVARNSNSIGAPGTDNPGTDNDARHFHGAARDVQIWDRPLGIDEVKRVMHGALGGKTEGLLHRWAMNTALVQSARSAPDTGTATPRHARLMHGAESVELAGPIPPLPANELRGRVSGLQLWEINRPIETLRDVMHQQLSGSEYGLVGYWKLGGIAEGGSVDQPLRQRISPDFSIEPVDAVVYGDTYVSACELQRANAVGKATRYSNDELVAVSQGGRYRETFDFRVVDADGYIWNQREVSDADGRGNSLFNFRYWGKATRTTDEHVALEHQSYVFESLADGWLRAQADVTIPNGINLIRSFEIDKVTGKWTNEQRAPQDEWVQLDIRKHGMELISDSVSRRTHTDDLSLPTLLADAARLDKAIATLPGHERRIASRREKLEDVLEALDVLANKQKYDAEQKALRIRLTQLDSTINTNTARISGFANDPLNYLQIIQAREVDLVLDAYGSHEGARISIHGLHGADNQKWEFVRGGGVRGDQFKIRNVADGRFVTSNGNGTATVFSSSGNRVGQYWQLIDAGSNWQGIWNVDHKGMLDVYAHVKLPGATLVTWPDVGATNQRWRFSKWLELRALEASEVADVARLRARLDQQIAAVPFTPPSLFRTNQPAAFALQTVRVTRLAALEVAFQIELQALRTRLAILRSQTGKRPAYDADLARLQRELESARHARTAVGKRLGRLDELLAGTLNRDELLGRRTRLENEITTLQDTINRINTDYVAQALDAASVAQTMSMVARDDDGMTTYGAVLGFASPSSGVSSSATAEGNVQLGYFDSRGRMRFTNYDATSDSTNAAFEQWLPDAATVCPDLDDAQAVLRLEAADDPARQSPPGRSAIALPETEHTVEAWFQYPMPKTVGTGRNYPLNFFSSDASGRESAIAVFDGRRLGVVVDSFFHDAGIDLGTTVSKGWHHVAARSRGALTLFFLDGEPVGYSEDEAHDRSRYAADFGSGGHLSLPATALMTGNTMSVQFWARWDSLSGRQTPVDLALYADGRRLTVWGTNGGLHVHSHPIPAPGTPGTPHPRDTALQAVGVLRKGEWHNIAVTIDESGVGQLYLNGAEVGRNELRLPGSMPLTSSLIGRNPDGGGSFAGAISELQLWNRVLSVAEIQRYMFEPPPRASTMDDDVGLPSELAHYWSMMTMRSGGASEVEDHVADKPLPGSVVDAATMRTLDSTVQAPIAAIGNRIGAGHEGGAPVGRLSELRVWSTALSDEEIRVNSRIRLTGNEPDLLAHYPLDDVLGGSAARDTTGVHADARPSPAATPVACTASVGHPGSIVARFNGGPARITLSSIDLRQSSFTVEFWVRRHDAERADWLIDHGRHTASSALVIGFRATGPFTFAFWGNDLDITVTDTARNVVSGENEWLHIANVWTYDPASDTGEQRIYVNGVDKGERAGVAPLLATGALTIGAAFQNDFDARADMAEIRIWDHARSPEQVGTYFNRRSAATEPGLMFHLPLDGRQPNRAADGSSIVIENVTLLRSDNLPIVPGRGVMTAEYSTMGPDPTDRNRQRAMLRRFYGIATDSGQVELLPGRRIEELELKWIGNAQFEPTLLGYIEGAPPVPSENLTVGYDYDGATSIELRRSEEVAYSWLRSKEVGGGLDINAFLGAKWDTDVTVGFIASISNTLTEGRVGVRGSVNTNWRREESSTIRSNSTTTTTDALELRGSFELDPAFPHLGPRWVPKNVGYALVVSGLADVFILQMKRTGRMVDYQVKPVADIPPDVNTITFLINPAYQINGSLDGLVGTYPADDRFCKDVPEMRAQYGSLYPSGYYNLEQAYNIKAQIDRLDEQRRTYFINFDARETGLSDALLDQIPDVDTQRGIDIDTSRQIDTVDGVELTDSEKEARDEKQRADLEESAEAKSKEGTAAAKKKRAEIDKLFKDPAKNTEAAAAFSAWQQRMEGLQIRSAKRNIVNNYVWDADGGLRTEEQSYANTIEHTIGGSFSLNASLGLDADITFTVVNFELQAMATLEMTQSTSKTSETTNTLDLNVRLDGLERSGITDLQDYPLQPGEKVDRFRFMSYYLEGDTDHFHDFFSDVVDPEWLMSNDEEARALRQVASGKANKTWRVMHRVTYVERPVLLGFGRDVRTDESLEDLTDQVYSQFDDIARGNQTIKSDIGAVRSKLEALERKLDGLNGTTPQASRPTAPLPVPAGDGEVPVNRGDPTDGVSERRDGEQREAAALAILNNGSEADLIALNGIGKATARAILDRRRQRGDFSTIDELRQVSGIGPATIINLRAELVGNDHGG